MRKPKALIIGSHGMLGQELVRQAEKFTDWEIVTSDVSDEGGIDISKEESVKEYFGKVQPDIVINCAAFTNVDACEDPKNWELVKAVNGLGPGYLAKHSKENNALFIHISTDYVFGDNREEGYPEDYDKFKPLNKYAESKLIGEQEVKKYISGEDSRIYIVRTSWLFGKGAKNFLAKMLELAETMKEIKVVADEVSSPTYVKDLAQRLIYIAEEQPVAGIYHIAGRGAASRYDFARAIFKYAKKDVRVKPTTLAEFGRTTGIAHYSVLLNTKFSAMRPWKEMVEDFLTNDQ